MLSVGFFYTLETDLAQAIDSLSPRCKAGFLLPPFRNWRRRIPITRKRPMKQLLALIVASLWLGWMGSPQAAILTFEDLDPAPATYDAMPTPYSGFTFNGWYYGPDTFYTPASGTIDLFTDYFDPDQPDLFFVSWSYPIKSSDDFIFDGAWFSGYSGVSYALRLDGIFVHFSLGLPNVFGDIPYGPTFLASGYSQLVDEVFVIGVQGYFAMDDFTFHRNATEPNPTIPEPSTFALILLPATGLLLRRRRR